MAEDLARIICTEEDKVNCPFYYKNGACRYGDRCTRRHLKPKISQTLLFKGMYENPPIALAMAEGTRVPDEQMMEAINHFQSFYADVFLKLAELGQIEEMHVCDNIGDHLIGNVYVKFIDEDAAEKCKDVITGKKYANRLVFPEYSPVSDFREGRCRQYEDGNCMRGGKCNFMHLKIVPKHVKKALLKEMLRRNPEYKKTVDEENDRGRNHKSKGRRRSRSRDRKRSRSRDRKSKKDKKKKKHKKRRTHSRSRSRTRRSRSRSPGAERENRKGGGEIGEASDLTVDMLKMNSEERRATFASWNEQEKQQTQEPQPAEEGAVVEPVKQKEEQQQQAAETLEVLEEQVLAPKDEKAEQRTEQQQFYTLQGIK